MKMRGVGKSLVDGQSPLHHEMKPWLKPLFLGIYVGEPYHSRVPERWCEIGFAWDLEFFPRVTCSKPEVKVSKGQSQAAADIRLNLYLALGRPF